MQKVEKMTLATLNDLKAELEYLKTERSDEVAEQIKIARGYGDLSENSEYDEAKNEQGKLYSRIAELEYIIANAVIIEEPLGTDTTVGHGSKVVIKFDEEDEEEAYTIVGTREVDPLEGKISDASPIGKAIVGKGAGDRFVVKAPNGHMAGVIISVTR
ncbi:MAG: transcription elongation factor GreA [Clostridia bacterium]|nr:transcription elongation factor GreA [Clostridia bacterium]